MLIEQKINALATCFWFMCGLIQFRKSHNHQEGISLNLRVDNVTTKVVTKFCIRAEVAEPPVSSSSVKVLWKWPTSTVSFSISEQNIPAHTLQEGFVFYCMMTNLSMAHRVSYWLIIDRTLLSSTY